MRSSRVGLRQPRSAAGRFLVPQHGPAARRQQETGTAAARCCAAGSALRPGGAGLSAEHLAGVGKHLRAADALLLPTIPTTLSLRTMEQLLDFMQGHGLNTPVYAFYSMVDRRKRMHLDIISSPADPRCKVLETTIPYATEVERMGLERRPVTDYAPRSTAARAYQARCGTR